MLVSPILRAEKGCLVFWYHMKGRTVGRLRLYFSTSVANTVLFEKNGAQDRKWLLGKVTVNSTLGTLTGYKVRIYKIMHHFYSDFLTKRLLKSLLYSCPPTTVAEETQLAL